MIRYLLWGLEYMNSANVGAIWSPRVRVQGDPVTWGSSSTKWGPKQGSLGIQSGYIRNTGTQLRIFSSYSYYILRVPNLGLPCLVNPEDMHGSYEGV